MTTESPIDTYIAAVLTPQLRLCKLSPAQQALVTDDVRSRLSSLLAHWHDLPFRRTVLLWGLEEASFYDPGTAGLEVRALVAVAIRNSLVEDLAASKSSVPELDSLEPWLTDEDMPVLTRTAIEHFQKAAFDRWALQGDQVPSEDPFASLAGLYPRAWRHLSQLANSSSPEVTYELPSAPVPDLPAPPASGQYLTSSEVNVVLSGMDPGFDSGLLAYLQQIKEGLVSFFFSDSFKGITRNPRKLCHVIEYVLSQGAAVVTHNYYLGPTYASRREPLLRPFHMATDTTAKLANSTGLSQRHREMLAFIKSFLD